MHQITVVFEKYCDVPNARRNVFGRRSHQSMFRNLSRTHNKYNSCCLPQESFEASFTVRSLLSMAVRYTHVPCNLEKKIHSDYYSHVPSVIKRIEVIHIDFLYEYPSNNTWIYVYTFLVKREGELHNKSFTFVFDMIFDSGTY